MSYPDSYQTSAYAAEPVAIRRPDPLAGLLLVLAGAGIGISIFLEWFENLSGREFLQRGLLNIADFTAFGTWQVLAIVVSGAVLLLFGLLAFIPAKSRRTLGVIALLVAGGMVAAVLTFLMPMGFDFSFVEASPAEAGFYVVVGATVLGLLGALKAALTPPKRVS